MTVESPLEMAKFLLRGKNPNTGMAAQVAIADALDRLASAQETANLIAYQRDLFRVGMLQRKRHGEIEEEIIDTLDRLEPMIEERLGLIEPLFTPEPEAAE